MKISKEKLIKLFKDGISRLEIRNANEMEMQKDAYSDRIRLQSFVIQDRYTLFGTMQLYIESDVFFISFFPNDSDSFYDHSASYAHSHADDDLEIKHKLTKREFSRLSKIFKKKYFQFAKLRADVLRRNTEAKNEVINGKMEILSDMFELDFFPKKRMLLTEKTIGLVRLGEIHLHI